jgi:hypothetical protein
MTLTPSAKGAFLAGIGLWCLMWLSLFKADEIAEAVHLQRWISSDRCLRWIRQHKGTSLLGTELFNYGTHGISDPLGVTFALAGTFVNVLVIYGLLPLLNQATRDSKTIDLQF